MRVLPCGDAAVLLEVADVDAVLALADAVRQAGLSGVVDVVPAARTVLVAVQPGTDLAALRQRLVSLARTADPAPHAVSRGPVVTIGVHYDGPDLDEVADLTGLSRQQVISAHTAAPWRVAFGGFAPGFAYLTGGDPRLEVPRRSEPRTAVPGGSVALAGRFTGVYPRSSPGGWQLIGRTDVVLWDLHRDPPALLPPDGWVQFVDAAGR